jgi:hypothetical protein
VRLEGFEVRARGTLIGRAVLHTFSAEQRLALGHFYADAAYEAVRPVFVRGMLAEREPDGRPRAAVDAAARERYLRERDALGLELVTESGDVLPADTIDVLDTSATGGPADEPTVLAVGISDAAYWRTHEGDAGRVPPRFG